MSGMRRTAADVLPAPRGHAMPYIPVAARPGRRDVCCCTRSFEMETCTCPRQQQAARGCCENLLLRASSQAMLLAYPTCPRAAAPRMRFPGKYYCIL